MHLKSIILRSFTIAAILYLAASCTTNQSPAVKPAANEFSFVFMTDIHLQYEKNAEAGFRAAIIKANELKPDFVITGGDLVMDALGQTYGRADSLFKLYVSMQKEFKMPVYNTIGNHEHYGWNTSSGADTNNPEYGDKMFEKRIGPRYQRIDHKGWVFFLLDDVMKDGKDGYEGRLDDEQIEWLKFQLKEISRLTPIAISLHIPLLTTEAQMLHGATAANPPGEVVVNSREVEDLFKDYNLKLVLQGHLHFFETMYVFGTNYITGGSVAGAWWEGPYLDTQEGFVLLKIKGEDVSWQYIDDGWLVR
jgi:3',5'-cyclic AMP phosphodiesterase CpdA